MRVRAKEHKYTDEQLEFVRDKVKGTPYKELREMFNNRFKTDLTRGQILGFLRRNKLSNEIDGSFKPNQVSWVKGKRGVNHKPIGSERVNNYGYTLVKVKEPNVWKFKHRIMWEEVNGKIPSGHVLLFGDGDRSNMSMDNLLLVTNSQLTRLNRQDLIQNDVELTKVALNIVDLQGLIKERENA